MSLFKRLRQYDVNQPSTVYEYIFDRDAGIIYTRVRSEGHPKLRAFTRINEAICLGGELRWINNTLRTNEMSGHYGRREIDGQYVTKWDDASRFGLILFFETLNIDVLHEPHKPDNLFSCLSDDELRLYQKNFIRKRGNSVLNPSLGFPYARVSESLYPLHGERILYRNRKKCFQNERRVLSEKYA